MTPSPTATGAVPALRWEVEGLEQELAALWPRLSVQVLGRCESTNSLLLDRARGGGNVAFAATPCLLVAEQQTRGRGRMGRTWLAAPGASLTFSLGLALAPRDWSGLSLAIGLALAEALDPPPEGDGRRIEAAPAMRIALKWPNDLWLAPGAAGHGCDASGSSDAHAAVGASGGAKLGGILVETVAVEDGRAGRYCVIGIGLNVQPLPSAMAEGLGAGHACLQSLEAQATAPLILRRVAPPLLRALRAFEREGFAPLVERYATRDLLRGHEVSTSLAEPAIGWAEGVDEQGALLLHAGGRRQRIVSGEVSVRRSADAVGMTSTGAATPRPHRSA